MIAFAFLDRAGLLAADLARKIPPGESALWTRLNAMLRAPTKEELDVLGVMKQERAMSHRVDAYAPLCTDVRQHIRNF